MMETPNYKASETPHPDGDAPHRKYNKLIYYKTTGQDNKVQINRRYSRCVCVCVCVCLCVCMCVCVCVQIPFSVQRFVDHVSSSRGTFGAMFQRRLRSIVCSSGAGTSTSPRLKRQPVFVGGSLYPSTSPVVVLCPAGRLGRVGEVDAVEGTSRLAVYRNMDVWRKI